VAISERYGFPRAAVAVARDNDFWVGVTVVVSDGTPEQARQQATAVLRTLVG